MTVYATVEQHASICSFLNGDADVVKSALNTPLFLSWRDAIEQRKVESGRRVAINFLLKAKYFLLSKLQLETSLSESS
jgi:hypothetical protein